MILLDLKSYHAALAMAIKEATAPYREALGVIENDLRRSEDIPITILLPILKVGYKLLVFMIVTVSFPSSKILSLLLGKQSNHSLVDR